MTGLSNLAAVAGAVVMAFAAAGKSVDPSQLARSISELTDGRLHGRSPVYAVAFVEISAAGLVVAIDGPFPGLLLGSLGLAFVLVGRKGRRLGLTAPCGCFGVRSSEPLGERSIILGLGIAILGALATGARPSGANEVIPLAVAIVATCSVLLQAGPIREALTLVATRRRARDLSPGAG